MKRVTGPLYLPCGILRLHAPDRSMGSHRQGKGRMRYPTTTGAYDVCDVESTLYTGQNTTEFVHGEIPTWEQCDTELDEDRDFDGGELMEFRTEAVEELVGEELCLKLEKKGDTGKDMLFYVRFDEARAPRGPGNTPTIKISYKQLT
ncbi:hypothetical protein ACWY4P_50145 [Streptomyces sp. LZ34]